MVWKNWLSRARLKAKDKRETKKEILRKMLVEQYHSVEADQGDRRQGALEIHVRTG